MNNKLWDELWINATLATMENQAPYGLIKQAALAIDNGKIAFAGKMSELPHLLAKKTVDAEGQLITPGLIDCHTHLVYAGNRANEFEMRLQGATYEEIARQGGGIHSTVLKTRTISEEKLLEESLERARILFESGVTTIEIKSGYGLNLETELKILRVAKKIGELLPITVCSTFLGAHAVPLEYKNRADEYVNYVCEEMIPAVVKENLANAVDVFCETIGFTLSQTERVFETATKFDLKIKCHAEQLSQSGAALLSAKYHAFSVDHLEFLSENDIAALAQSKTTAVLLPGAFYFLREKKLPPIALLRKFNIPIAIASDCNPGTSPITNLPLVLNMACVLFQMTPEEALRGVTINAAKALGMENEIGTLSVGKNADFVLWKNREPAELAYFIGNASVDRIVKKGAIVFG